MTVADRLRAAEAGLAAARAAVAAENEAQWAVTGAEAGRAEAQRRIAARASSDSTGTADGEAAPSERTANAAGSTSRFITGRHCTSAAAHGPS